MYIVYITFLGYPFTKHSAWYNEYEAQHQAKVLREAGYRKVVVQFQKEYFGNLENGHYFI